MARHKRRSRKRASKLANLSIKTRERLHVLRMRFKPKLARRYIK